jgi:hypothetical protein
MHGRIKQKGLGSSARGLLWFVRAALFVGQQQGPVIRSPFTGVIQRVDGYVGTAPTGANIIIDIRKGPTLVGLTSIWSINTSNRLNIAAGAQIGSQYGLTNFDTISVKAGDLLALDLVQVGSTIPGSDMTIILTVRE